MISNSKKEDLRANLISIMNLVNPLGSKDLSDESLEGFWNFVVSHVFKDWIELQRVPISGSKVGTPEDIIEFLEDLISELPMDVLNGYLKLGEPGDAYKKRKEGLVNLILKSVKNQVMEGFMQWDKRSKESLPPLPAALYLDEVFKHGDTKGRYFRLKTLRDLVKYLEVQMPSMEYKEFLNFLHSSPELAEMEKISLTEPTTPLSHQIPLHVPEFLADDVSELHPILKHFQFKDFVNKYYFGVETFIFQVEIPIESSIKTTTDVVLDTYLKPGRQSVQDRKYAMIRFDGSNCVYSTQYHTPGGNFVEVISSFNLRIQEFINILISQ